LDRPREAAQTAYKTAANFLAAVAEKWKQMITEAGIKAALTRAAIKDARVVELRDGGGRGEGRLALFIRPTKSKVSGEPNGKIVTEWYAVWYRDNRKRMMKLGVYPSLSLSEARKAFREKYLPAISAGDNPVGTRTRRPRIGVTVKDLFQTYVDNLKAADKPSWVMAHHILLSKSGASKTFGEEKRAADITPLDIRDHLASIHDRGSIVKARDARAYLHAAFAFGLKAANSYTSAVGSVDWGYQHNPVSAVPADRSEAANRVGERHLKPAEVRTFWEWLSDKKRRSMFGDALRLMICTGQRVSEILVLSDPAYDRQEAMLDWLKTKNGLPHAVPLSTRAAAILDDRPVNSHGLYFPHLHDPREEASVAGIEKHVRRFLKDHPTIPHFTPRDLRRTWKTLSGAAGISKEVRDRMQNHARQDVSARHYDRYDYLAEKRAAVATWDAYLTRILSGELDNPVSTLRPAIAEG
jgi:integrase